MKKNKLAKKSRKIFSAILAGAILTTSVIPESFVWAADAEKVQGFGDSESMDFGSGFETEQRQVDLEEEENQELLDFQSEDDAADMEEAFTDQVDLFSSEGNLAVETTSANTISPGGNTEITSGGTYTVEGGTYESALVIKTTEKVTLEIDGDIEVSGGAYAVFVDVQDACEELTINNKGTVNNVYGGLLQNKNSKATVTFEGGSYKAYASSAGYMIENAGVINFRNVTFSAKQYDGAYFVKNTNASGTVNIYSGTVFNTGEVSPGPCIYHGIVNMEGGKIVGQERFTLGIYADELRFTGGKLENLNVGIGVQPEAKSLVIGGDATFENNNTDIYLMGGQMFSVQDDFKGTASVDVSETTIACPRQITTAGISPDMRARFTSVYSPYSINYDTTGKYLYFGDHEHLWNYVTSADKIVAECTAKTDCEFNSGKLDLILTATDEVYSGKAYTGATVTNNITYATGDEPGILYYLKDGTLTNSSNSGASSEGAAPVKPGSYTVKVTVGDQTMSADFKISRCEMNPTVTIVGWIYGQIANTPTVKVELGEMDITNLYDASQITCKYYTDENCTNVTTAANGAATDGAVPENAGTYYVKAAVAENAGYAAGSAIAKFTIEKAAPELNVSAVEKNYGEEAFNLEVSNKGDGLKSYKSSNDGVVTVDENGRVTIVGAGTATVTVSIAESANYISDEKSVTVNVKKIDHNLTVDNLDYKVTYGDPAFKITANPGDTETDIKFASDNEKVAAVSADGTVTIGNAGKAWITVSMGESKNYIAVLKTVTVTVAPKEITVTADNASKVYGDKEKYLSYHADGLVGDDTLSGITVKRKAGEKVGTYAVTASQETGANPNYRITFKKGIFTIQQADQSKLKGKDVYRLKLPVFFAKAKAKKSSIALSWTKCAGADGYDVYWRYCDSTINYKKAGTVKNGKLSMPHKNLKKDREYKYFIAAYKIVEGRKIYIAKSNGLHVAMKQAGTTNAASIKVNKTKVTLKVGKNFRLKCEIKAENSSKDLISHASAYRYYTTNSKVATVSKAGVIKAKGKGKCSIYVLANNGVYKKVKVQVK